MCFFFFFTLSATLFFILGTRSIFGFENGFDRQQTVFQQSFPLKFWCHWKEDSVNESYKVLEVMEFERLYFLWTLMSKSTKRKFCCWVVCCCAVSFESFQLTVPFSPYLCCFFSLCCNFLSWQMHFNFPSAQSPEKISFCFFVPPLLRLSFIWLCCQRCHGDDAVEGVGGTGGQGGNEEEGS